MHRSRPNVPGSGSPLRVVLDDTDRLLQLLFRRSVRRVGAGLLLTAGCLSSEGDPESKGTARGASDSGVGADAQGALGADAEVGDAQSGDAGSDASQPPETFSAFPALPEGGCDWQLGELNLASEVAYLKVASAHGELPGEPAESPNIYVTAEHGLVCQGAPDLDACQAERTALEDALVASLAPCTSEGSCPSAMFVLTTKAGEVKLWPKEELPQLLGDIDNPAEAWLLFASAGLGGYTCGDVHQFGYQETPDGILLRSLNWKSMCDPLDYYHDTYLVRPDGTIEKISSVLYSSDPDACIVYGRRPSALRSMHKASTPDPLASFFGRAAHLEAASVPAFEIIAKELEALGAPRALVQKAWQARADEITHAISVGALAERFGAELTAVDVGERPLRGSFELALDNAVEGCVHETFAALLGTFQAAHAGDPEIRRVMQRIAEDETRHAGLAWQIAAWLTPQLSDDERAQILVAQRAAVEKLRAEVSTPEHPMLREMAGVPSAAQARALVHTLETSLWQAALEAA